MTRRIFKGQIIRSTGSEVLRDGTLAVDLDANKLYIHDGVTPGGVSLSNGGSSELPSGDFKGSVYSDDSTLLVDGVNGLITGRVTGPTYDPTNTVLLADPEDGDSYYNVRSRDGNTLLVDAVNAKIIGNVETTSISNDNDIDIASGDDVAIITSAGSSNYEWFFNSGGYLDFPDNGELFFNGDAGIQFRTPYDPEAGTTANISIRDTGSSAQLQIINEVADGQISIQSSDIRIGDIPSTSGIFIGQHNINNTTITNLYGDYIFREREIRFDGSDIIFTNFGGSKTPTVDFTNATVTGLTATPNNLTVSNNVVSVGGTPISAGNLSIRVVDTGSNSVNIQLQYSSSSNTIAASASVQYVESTTPSAGGANLYNGKTTLAQGNTDWVNLTPAALSEPGDSVTLVFTDHSFHKIYRVTASARDIPDGVIIGTAYVVIEELK